jgi:hypothetical protein
LWGWHPKNWQKCLETVRHAVTADEPDLLDFFNRIKPVLEPLRFAFFLVASL